MRKITGRKKNKGDRKFAEVGIRKISVNIPIPYLRKLADGVECGKKKAGG
jgi:hypothetical protein